MRAGGWDVARLGVAGIKLAWLALAAMCLTLHTQSTVFAQLSFEGLNSNSTDGGGNGESQISIAAQFTAPTAAGQPGKLYITADVAAGWHIYSLTQPPGGPVATKIKLDNSPNYELAGEFETSPPAHLGLEPEAFGDLMIETHEGQVVWQAPVRFASGVNPADVTISGRVMVQACNDRGCLPPTNYPFTAKLGQGLAEPHDMPANNFAAPAKDAKRASIGEFHEDLSQTTIRGHVDHTVATPGSTIKLQITADPEAGYHTYAWQPTRGEQTAQPALIALAEDTQWKWSTPRADKPMVEHEVGGEQVRYHEGPVTWTIDVEVPQDAQPGEHVLSGIIGYQSCSDESCDMPRAATFDVVVNVGQAQQPGNVPLAFMKDRYSTAAKVSEAWSEKRPVSLDLSTLKVNSDGQSSKNSLPLMILYGLIGGLALNLMPCVLPVVGLKILAFVQQSGESRARVFELNLWYSLGLISVFLVLAALAIGLGLGWGQQFSSLKFNVIMVGVVFVMGLSFLGVWELPIPGFAASGSAQELSSREGRLGAFSKGIITTILATPCTGPLMSTALIWAMKQPAPITTTVFASIGVGMASPYLLIGMFPSLIRFLPKPGAWMDTFKNLMGFMLLATVVYLLTVISEISPAMVLPTVAMLFGLWAACWWVGRTPGTASFDARIRAWAAALAFSALIAVFSFQWFSDVMQERFNATLTKEIAAQLQSNGEGNELATAETDEESLQWLPFNREKLDQLIAENKTVMVDFTAAWCPNCKLLERLVLNTKPTREYVDKNGIVAMVADVTSWPEDETQLLQALIGTGGQIPVLAIFPAGRPNEPIVLNEMYTRNRLFEELDRAGPSQVSSTASTASDDANDLAQTVGN